MVTLISLLIALAGATVEGSSNNNGYGVLRDSTTYVDVDGRIARGYVRAPWPNARSDVYLIDQDNKMVNLGPDHVAVIGRANCWPLVSRTCVGDRVAVGGVASTLVGFFPISGDWIARGADGGLKRVNRSSFNHVDVRAARGPRDVVAAALAGQDLTLLDLLQTWSDGAAAPRAPERCVEPKYFDRRLKTDAEGFVDPECVPKILYSWGDWKRLKWLQLRLGAFGWGDRILIGQPLFVARSPVATFGFGSFDERGGYPMRVELAPGVRFRVLGVNTPWPDCARVPDPANTVYIRALGSYDGARPWGDYAAEDFMICSSAVIRSWSYGTKESYDEIVRDVRKAIAGTDWDGYVTYRERAGRPYRPFFLNINADNHPFTQLQLIETLKRLLIYSARDQGGVYVNPSLAPGRRTTS